MTDHHFISYSSADAFDFAFKLYNALVGGKPSIPAWRDKDKIKPGRDWDEQIVEGIKTCKSMIFVMTKDSIMPESVCKNEWTKALSYKKPVIPILLDKDVSEMPFGLGSRQYIDFTSNFDAGLAVLRDHLIWLDSPEGKLQSLKDRLADAKRALSRAEVEKHALIKDDIAQLQKDIENQKRIINDPQAAIKQVDIAEMEVHANERALTLPEVRFRSVLPEYPEKLKELVVKNRALELENARKYLEDHRILLISGIGGVGKTTLARALVENRPAGIPVPFWFDFSRNKDEKLETLLDRLADYLNAPHILKFKTDRKEAGQVDIDLFINELKVALWFVFDNLETVLSEKNFRDKGIDSLFTSLRGSEHAAKIIITSRRLPELRNGEALVDAAEDEEKQEIKGLRIHDAVEFLKKSGLGKIMDEDLIKLAESVDGHPLALKLFIGLAKKTSVADIMKDLGKFKKRKEEIIKNTKMLFDRLAGDEKELLERISVYRRPEQESAIKKMFTKETSVDAVDKLIDESLLETDHNGKYWLHPLVREFAYDDLKNKNEIHKLACEYYFSLQIPGNRLGIEGVRNLIEAHHHACEAKEYDRAAEIIFDTKMHKDLEIWGNGRTLIELCSNRYINRRRRPEWLRNSRTLIELYSRLLPEDRFNGEPLLRNKKNHSVVLGNLGLAYSALGQVKKAKDCYKKALAIGKEIKDPQIVNLCEEKLGIVPDKAA